MQTFSKLAVFCVSVSTFAGGLTAMAQKDENAKIAAYFKSMPAVNPPDYNETERHAPGPNRPGYLWQRDGKPKIADEYDKHRAFYGCLDWHSAVNSTWMMVSL